MSAAEQSPEITQPATAPTGIPFVDCQTCGRRHPATREHCPSCGLAHIFPCSKETR